MLLNVTTLESTRMTTIVKIGKAIAIDSKITENGIVLDNDFQKYFDDKKNVYLFTGSMCNFEAMAKAYRSKSMNKKKSLFIDTTMIVFNKRTGEVTQVKTDKENRTIKVSPVTCHTYCAGSGRKYAYGAIANMESDKVDLSHERVAIRAIEAASKYDNYTSANINSWVADMQG